MDLVLYPRVAPQDRLAYGWVFLPPRPLRLSLGASMGRRSYRPRYDEVASVRPDAMLPPGVASAEVPRAFTGVYEFAGLQPDTLYTITVQAGNQSATLETRTLPMAVPTEAG